MTDYKLVPIGPTPEMVEAAEDAYMPFGDMEIAIRMAVLAAPAVQGEPVDLRQRLFAGWKGCSNHGCIVVDPKPGMMRTNGICKCVVNAIRSQLYMLQSRIQSLIAAPQPAEQQTTPDVAALVEALSIARDYVFSSLEEKKLALAGYPQMWRCEQDDLAMIDAALSAYRKETSHDK